MGKEEYMISYTPAPDIHQRISHITQSLQLGHIDLSRVRCLRSRGSGSRRTLARCHTTSRALQAALPLPAHYIIEVLSETFDRLSPEDQTKTLIHELLHIPRSFGGGFRHHDFVCARTVEKFYTQYLDSVRKPSQPEMSWWKR